MQQILNFEGRPQAPAGFVTDLKEVVSKKYGDNICRHCDARKLCQDNTDDWCRKNPCMPYSRPDGLSVVFVKSNV